MTKASHKIYVATGEMEEIDREISNAIINLDDKV